jgi:flavorubredoxin
MPVKINKNVTWMGKVDWEIRSFHGEEYSTYRGTTYNSYLVKDNKVALIDTVWSPFSKEYINNLKKELDLSNIDYVIANHAEIDHSGALPELMQKIPDKPIYCTKNGLKSFKGHYHKNWNFKVVKTGDKISLGEKDLIFIEARMLHWPDSMFCYLTGDNILFSNDAFGQHYATELLYNDLVDTEELYQEAIKYYANILTPFSKLVQDKINELLKLKLPVDMICPSHGVVWRKEPLQIVNKYLQWAKDYQVDQITIIYDTMWDGTRKIAEAIAEGIKGADKKTTVKLFNSARSDKNTIITEVFKSKTVLVGSPTINKGILSSLSAILEQIKGLSFKNKKAVSFGCYGWSGEGIKVITEGLREAGFEIINEGLKVLWNPDDEAIAECIKFGNNIGKI